MKLVICDVDVVEQANIPKFSKLDNVGRPLRLFELVLDNALVDLIVGFIKLYGDKEKTDANLKCFAYS